MAIDRFNPPNPEKRNRLVEAVREIKIATAERSDVVVEMKEADRARLEILAQELESVFAEVPADDERFDFAISSGLQPRLWIDATAHVMMGKDRRQYRFVRDTRLGRVVLAESHQTGPIADSVTTYIAERIYERELALAGDDITYRAETVPPQPIEKPATEVEKPVEAPAPKPLLMTQPVQESKPAPIEESKPAISARDMQSKIEPSMAGWFLLGIFIVGGAILLSK
ncbi:MAG: hypothetical protein AAGF25_04290 [Pseudomonadota bacterium]